MLLLMETCAEACFCVSCCTRLLVVSPFSASRCSIQVSGKVSDELPGGFSSPDEVARTGAASEAIICCR